MTDAEPEPTPAVDGHTVQLVWADDQTVPVVYANQLLVQVDFADGRPDTVILTIGRAIPPMLSGTSEQQTAQLRAVEAIPIVPLGRFSISRRRIKEFTKVIAETTQRLDNLWPEEEE